MKLLHPAKLWPSRWIFDDRSEEPTAIQVIDLLTDIRLFLLVLITNGLF